jgi:hypothetical protein
MPSLTKKIADKNICGKYFRSKIRDFKENDPSG